MADPAWVTNARARRDKIYEILASLDEAAPTQPMDRPNKTGEGIHADGQGQKKGLLEELAVLEKRLDAAGYGDGEAGIYESFERA